MYKEFQEEYAIIREDVPEVDIYIIKHSHIRSFTVAETLTGDKCDLAVLRTVPVYEGMLISP